MENVKTLLGGWTNVATTFWFVLVLSFHHRLRSTLYLTFTPMRASGIWSLLGVVVLQDVVIISYYHLCMACTPGCLFTISVMATRAIDVHPNGTDSGVYHMNLTIIVHPQGPGPIVQILYYPWSNSILIATKMIVTGFKHQPLSAQLRWYCW